METRTFGSLWPVSALTLGGGGIGQVWGATTRDEAIATTREAVEADPGRRSSNGDANPHLRLPGFEKLGKNEFSFEAYPASLYSLALYRPVRSQV